MHACRNLAILFFHFDLFPSFIPMTGPQILFHPKLQKDLVLRTQTWKAMLSLTLLFFPCLLSLFLLISSCMPSARFSGYSSPDVYYKGSGPDVAKQNALHVTGEKRRPWVDSPVRQEDTVNTRLTLSCQLSRLPLMYSQKAPGHYAVVDTPKNPGVTLGCGVIHS